VGGRGSWGGGGGGGGRGDGTVLAKTRVRDEESLGAVGGKRKEKMIWFVPAGKGWGEGNDVSRSFSCAWKGELLLFLGNTPCSS